MVSRTAHPPATPSDASRFYRVVLHAAAVVFGALSVFLFAAPRNFLDGLALQLTPSTDFLCRRAAVLLLGVAVLCFFARNAATSKGRKVVAVTMLVTTGAMALLGTVEFARGATSAGIFKAVGIEGAFAVCFTIILFRHDDV